MKKGKSLLIKPTGFQNEAEERMATLLEQWEIPYRYEVPFLTKEGKNHPTVDFVLKRPISIKLANHPIRFIEVKGCNGKSRLKKRDKKQQQELHAAGIMTFVVTIVEIAHYETVGLI